MLLLVLYMKTCRLGECSGISFMDSTPLRVCKNKRIHAHRVFRDIANVGRSTIGRFHGFKLHIIVNDKGEPLDFVITRASEDDRSPLKDGNFLKNIFGSLYGDKGYISKERGQLL